jgi:hypothetical protein
MTLRSMLKAITLRGLLAMLNAIDRRYWSGMSLENKAALLTARGHVMGRIAALKGSRMRPGSYGKTPIPVVDLTGQGIDTREGAS